MKTVCIYHSIDLDGWMSAAIVKYWFGSNKSKTNNDPLKSCNVYKEQGCSHVDGMLCNTKECDILHGTLDFIGYNYGQPIPDLSEYDKVIMCDISFPKEEMYKLVDRLDTNFIWIDHHFGAIRDIVGIEYLIENENISTIFNGRRRTDYSACELTWLFFFPIEEMPEIVRLLGRYDCFGHKGTSEEQKVLEFQYGARQCIRNYEEAYEYLTRENEISSHNGLSLVDNILNGGKAIYQYLCTEAKQVYKNGFQIHFPKTILEVPKSDIFPNSPIISISGNKNIRFICINKERFNPINFDIDYHKEGYDGAACFHYANGEWHFSLYNDNGSVDCSAIAKQYGGGGHKGAAGFRIKDINQIIK